MSLTALSSAAQMAQNAANQVRERIADFIAPKLKERRNLAERAANTDALTGLANRRAFDLAQAAAEQDARLSFILFDANNFGLCNKIKGHACGDLLLKVIAESLTTAAREFGGEQRVFRYAGDEFVIICQTNVAHMIRESAEKLFGAHEINEEIVVSLSGTVGCSVADADAGLQNRKTEKKNVTSKLNV